MLLIDGNNQFVKYNHVFSFMQSDGRNIGGMFGFVRNLWLMSKKLNDDDIYVIWDGKNSREKRRKIFTGYKEGRIQFDSSFFEIRSELKYVLENCLGINQVIMDDYEADDIIGYLAVTATNVPVYIVSADKDFWQLVNDKVYIFNGNKVLKWDDIKKVTGCKDSYEYLLCRALSGDNSDRIPGVPGIGMKKALKLIRSGNGLDMYIGIIKRNLELMQLGNENIESLEVIPGNKNAQKFMEWCRKYRFKSLIEMIGDFWDN